MASLAARCSVEISTQWHGSRLHSWFQDAGLVWREKRSVWWKGRRVQVAQTIFGRYECKIVCKISWCWHVKCERVSWHNGLDAHGMRKCWLIKWVAVWKPTDFIEPDMSEARLAMRCVRPLITRANASFRRCARVMRMWAVGMTQHKLEKQVVQNNIQRKYLPYLFELKWRYFISSSFEMKRYIIFRK